MMILSTLLALALGMQAATAQPIAGAPSAAAAPASDPAADLEQLRQMYADTCSAREFGAYDDMCDQLRQQVRLAERQAARAARHPAHAEATTPTPHP